jgi:hypothetical protein
MNIHQVPEFGAVEVLVMLRPALGEFESKMYRLESFA